MPFKLYIYLGAFVTYCDPILVFYEIPNKLFTDCFLISDIYRVDTGMAEVHADIARSLKKVYKIPVTLRGA